jgi:hypothetical protein
MSDNKPKHKSYASWGEYLASMDSVPDSMSWGERKWTGVRDLGEARKLAREGWAAGMERARAVALPAVEAATRETIEGACLTADVTGAAFDVGGYLSGEPECWVRPDAVETKPAVTIMASLSASAGIPAEALEMKGAAVAALAMALQAGGYAVKVYTCQGCPVDGEREATFNRVCLTDDNGGPLDVDRLIYGLAHPSALRALAFNAVVLTAGKTPTGEQWLGIPSNPPASLGWDCDLYLPASLVWDAEWKSPASVERWVKEQYRKLTAPKEGA